MEIELVNTLFSLLQLCATVHKFSPNSDFQYLKKTDRVPFSLTLGLRFVSLSECIMLHLSLSAVFVGLYLLLKMFYTFSVVCVFFSAYSSLECVMWLCLECFLCCKWLRQTVMFQTENIQFLPLCAAYCWQHNSISCHSSFCIINGTMGTFTNWIYIQKSLND